MQRGSDWIAAAVPAAEREAAARAARAQPVKEPAGREGSAERGAGMAMARGQPPDRRRGSAVSKV
jgi:hypothetical protein